jgi:carboxyl-terminal processing protease
MSTRLRHLGTILTLAMVVAACQTAETAPTTTTEPSAETTSPGAPATTTVPAVTRPVRLVGCDPADPDVEIVCETYDLIQRHYVDPVSDEDLAQAAAMGLDGLDGSAATTEVVCAAPAIPFQETCEQGARDAENSVEAAEAMVAGLATFGLDPNSVYLDPEAKELVEEEQHGEIQGIGALVTAEDASGDTVETCAVVSETCRMVIVSTIAGTPAEAAGLEREDVLVAVDSVDVIGQTIDEVTAQVRGPAGTPVTLTVDRDGELIDITIVRADIVIPVVVSEVVDDAGYLALTVFTDNADEEFASALEDLLAEGVDTLVIDLRDNPGGLLDSAIEVVSAFLPDGDVVVTESPESSISYPVSGHAIVPDDIGVVIVVNRGSASASEVVSAVLQERGRVTVVGENTFGKNTVQQRFNLSNGGALKLTIARWLTPGGADFGEVGVTPDVVRQIDVGVSPETVVREALAASVTVGGQSPSG